MPIRIIQPQAEIYSELAITHEEHVARCARVCYGHEGTTDNADALVNGLIKNGHLSMLRHESVYLRCADPIPFDAEVFTLGYTKVLYGYSDGDKLRAYVVTNGQCYCENRDVFEDVGLYRISTNDFYDACFDDYCRSRHKSDVNKTPLFDAYRCTICLTTQISTSRELNRVSPNNIAERSTRYCAVRGDLDICAPWWWDEQRARTDEVLRRRMEVARTTWLTCADNYNSLTREGMRPEDARGVLPLDAATRVVYTYSIEQWRHIFDLRLRGTTGRPHPNARQAAALMHDEISYFLKGSAVDLTV